MLVKSNPEEFFNFVEEFFSSPSLRYASESGFPKINLRKFEKDGKVKYAIDASISGYNKDEVEIKIDRRYLIISSKKSQDIEIDKSEYFLREIKKSSFDRRIILGERLDLNSAEVSFKDGIVTVEFEEDAEKLPKILQIK